MLYFTWLTCQVVKRAHWQILQNNSVLSVKLVKKNGTNKCFFKNGRSLGGVFPFILMWTFLALLLLQHVQPEKLFTLLSSFSHLFISFLKYSSFCLFSIFIHSALWSAGETIQLSNCPPFKTVSALLLFSFTAWTCMHYFIPVEASNQIIKGLPLHKVMHEQALSSACPYARGLRGPFICLQL